jgi:DNA-binding NarL/FixJ family response regulator
MQNRANGKTRRTGIFLVDDHAILRQGLSHLINNQSDLQVVGEAEDTSAALAGIRKTNPDLVVTDITLKNGDGFELIRTLREQQPEIPIVVLSMHEETLYASSVFQAGARAYITKDHKILQLIEAIHQVLQGKIYMSSGFMQSMMYSQLRRRADPNAFTVDQFSDREKEVFRLIARWRRPHEIARELNLSIKTVDYYRNRIKEKLNLTSVSQLTRFATEYVQRNQAPSSPPESDINLAEPLGKRPAEVSLGGGPRL